ncbi:Omp85 domain-containing protein [Lamellibrachia satsuma]|nr:Omp85 domain-containing protein [Lamellibrachia satsuma]
MGTVHAKTLSSDTGGPLKHQPLPSNEKDIVLSLVPVKVQHVHVDGITRTKNDILKIHIKDIFSADNFEDMVKKAHVARNKLDKLGMFKSIGIFIDTSKGPMARSDGYDITFQVVEHRRVTGGISTLIGTNEGSMLFNLKLPNTFGRAERLNIEYMYGTKKAIGYNLLFGKPLQGDPNLRLQAGVFQHSGEYPWSGYKEQDRGLSMDLSYPTLLGRHNIRWEGVWRDITCLADNRSFAVREHAGHSVKSALRHTWIRDKRDSTVMPSTGYCIELTQEIAGLGGDAKYVRHETEFQANKTLGLGTVVQLSLAGGIMKTIQPGGNIRINDRFFLGGPLTMRGFQMKGVGPRDAGRSLGADTYWLSGLHLYTPLPFCPGKGGFGDLFRTHLFVNAGNLTNIDLNNSWRDNLRQLGQAFRWSYGAGMVFKMGGIARMELNYVVPNGVQQGDSITKGLQFGIGIHFL